MCQEHMLVNTLVLIKATRTLTHLPVFNDKLCHALRTGREIYFIDKMTKVS